MCYRQAVVKKNGIELHPVKLEDDHEANNKQPTRTINTDAKNRKKVTNIGKDQIQVLFTLVNESYNLMNETVL